MMNTLLKKLVYIERQCGGSKEMAAKLENRKELDNFGIIRLELAQDMRQIRQDINERNELIALSENNKTTVSMTSAIRGRITAVEGKINEMQKFYDEKKAKVDAKIEKGKEIKPEVTADLQSKEEILGLARDHLKEIKKLNRKGTGAGGINERDTMMSTIAAPSSLPDLDDPQFAELRAKDAQIDAALDEIGNGVAILKDLANDLGKEISMHEQIILEIDKDVEKANAQLDQINTRMKKTLESVRKGNRFVMDFILLVVVLAIGGFLYNQFAS